MADYTLNHSPITVESFEVLVAAGEEKEIWCDHLEWPQMLLRNPQDFISLIGFHKLLSKPLHYLPLVQHLRRKRYDKIVIQTLHSILRYLFEVSHGWFDKVYDGNVLDALSRRVNVLVAQHIAIAQGTHFHYRSHDVLTIRVKN